MKTRIDAILHQEGDSAYGLAFPQFPGCLSAADRIEDLPAMAAEALGLWFEMPAPKVCVQDLQALGQRDLADGCQIALVVESQAPLIARP